MLNINIQPQNFLGSREEDFYVFLPHLGIVDIFFNGTESFEQPSKPFRQRTHVKSSENCSNGFLGHRMGIVLNKILDQYLLSCHKISKSMPLTFRP